MNILYELTYATRGQSGIPRDTKAVAEILVANQHIQTDFILNARSFTKRKRSQDSSLYWTSNVLGDALRKDSGRSVVPSQLVLFRIFLQSLSLRRKVLIFQIDELQEKGFFNFIDFKAMKSHTRSKIFLYSISYLARFLRPDFLRPFRIDTRAYSVFIQQQLDPIEVSKKSKHIVRLHDILPISHPQFFDQNGVRVFSKSLKLMLSGRSKIWVMDSTQSAVEFKANFGADLDVRVIPCVINSNQSFEKLSQLKKNQICIVNTIEPRKRTRLAIAGFKEAKNLGKISEDWKLFIFGNEGWQEKSLVESLRRNGFGQDVVFIEGASDFELEKIYAESRIVLSASAAEGFGLPPLEGMAHGCLPVVSDIPQHRETMGDLAFYFDGNDPSGIAAQLGQAINELKLNQDEIIKSTTKYVIDNFSALVIAKQWEVLLDSL